MINAEAPDLPSFEKEAAPALVIVALYALIYLAPLPLRPLAVPDEPRYGAIAREVLVSGDWVVPRLNGVRYFEKPILGHWLNAASMSLFGQNAFGLRFPSAAATGLAALALALLVRLERGTARAAVTAIVYLTCLEVFGVGVFAVLDPLLSLFVTAAMVSFYLAHRTSGRRRRLLLSSFGALCGLGFLAKGLVGVVVPAVAIVPFLLWQRRGRELLTDFWLPALCALLVVAPWALLIHAREPDFWHQFFWVEHVQRFVEAGNLQHERPLWFLLPYLLVGSLPWVLLLPAARGLDLADPLTRFSLCWLVFPFLLFSSSSGKIGTYVLPCFAPVAVLTSLVVTGDYAGSERAFRRAARIMAWIAAALALGVALLQIAPIIPALLYDDGESWKWILACTGLLIWSGLSGAAARAESASLRFRLYAAGPLCLMACWGVLVPPEVVAKSPAAFLESQRQRIQPDTIVVTDGRLFQTVAWEYGRSDMYMLTPGEIRYGLSFPDARGRLLDRPQLATLIGDLDRRRDVVLIVKRRWYERHADELQPASALAQNDSFVLAEFAAQPDLERAGPN